MNKRCIVPNSYNLQERFKLTIKYDGNTYCLSSLRYNKKRELIYSFPNNSKQSATSFLNGKWDDANLPDHITFHRDGNIHIKYKSKTLKDKKINRGKYSKNVFDMDENQYMFAIRHSFYFKHIIDNDINLLNDCPLLPKINVSNESENMFIWEVLKPIDFSVIVLILGKNLNPNFMPPKLKQLIYPNTHPILLREPFLKKDNLYLTSKFKDTNILLLLSHKIPNPNTADKTVVSKVDTNNKGIVISNFDICPSLEILSKLPNNTEIFKGFKLY